MTLTFCDANLKSFIKNSCQGKEILRGHDK
jgi:hypothetical protein